MALCTPARAISAQANAMAVAVALRLKQGISTRPATGSHTRPCMLFSVSATAESAMAGVPPHSSTRAALAMAAAQCAQRALESERFDTARHLAQRGLAWNNGSLYASAALMLHLWDILARCAQSAGLGQEEAAFADYRQAYAAQPVRARYHLAMARYQLERGKTVAAEAELRAVSTPPEEDRVEYRILQARLAAASGRYAEAMTALRQAERTGPLPKLLERELLQAMELAARELQDYKTAYECAARQLKL